jgi:hypothetical protein
MVRLLLTLCYALTALPGPGLCCCTFRPRAEHPAAPAPAEPCCPCCQTDRPVAAPEHEPAPSRCDCKEKQADEATLPAAEPPAAPAVSFDIPSGSTPAAYLSDATPAPPFHEADRLLRVFHLLRC